MALTEKQRLDKLSNTVTLGDLEDLYKEVF